MGIFWEGFWRAFEYLSRVKTQCQDPGNEDVAVGECSVPVERKARLI